MNLLTKLALLESSTGVATIKKIEQRPGLFPSYIELSTLSLHGALSSLDEFGSASSLHSDRIFSNALAQTPYSNYFYIYSI